MTKPTNHKPTKPNQTTKPKKQTKPTNKNTAINFCAAMCSRKYLLGISGINLGRWNAKNQQEDEKGHVGMNKGKKSRRMQPK